MSIGKLDKAIKAVVGCDVTMSYKYDNGFSFCVASELDAYKAAYAYRTMPRVKVEKSANIENCWVVAVYNK